MEERASEGGKKGKGQREEKRGKDVNGASPGLSGALVSVQEHPNLYSPKHKHADLESSSERQCCCTDSDPEIRAMTCL